MAAQNIRYAELTVSPYLSIRQARAAGLYSLNNEYLVAAQMLDLDKDVKNPAS